MEPKVYDLEDGRCGTTADEAATKKRRVHFGSPAHLPRPRSYLAVHAMTSSRASTDSIVSHPRAGSTIQDRLRQLDGGHDDESVTSFSSVPLVRISYRRLLAYWAAVPVSAALVLAAFVALLFWLQPPPTSTPPPHGDSPWPLRELLVAAAACTACYALRGPVWSLATLLTCSAEWPATAAAAVLQSILEEAARLGVFALLAFRPLPSSVALSSAWFLATGFAATSAVVGISQDYAKLALYRDVLHADSDQSDIDDGFLDTASSSPVGERSRLRSNEFMRQYYATDHVAGPSTAQMPTRRGHDSFGDSAYDDAGEHLERELAQLLAIKQRAEIEDVYGVPLPNIPVFVAALQRIDAIILAFGLTLIIGASWARAVATRHHGDHTHFDPRIFLDTLPAFAAVVVIHIALSLLWALALPRIGAPTASYAALLVALATFFAGLASWGILS